MKDDENWDTGPDNAATDGDKDEEGTAAGEVGDPDPEGDESGKPTIDEPTGPALDPGPDEFDKQAEGG
jgi:hypothetical protein